MKNEKVIGKLYLFKVHDDGTIERREINLIGKNYLCYVTRDPVTNRKYTYRLKDIGVYKNSRVLLVEDNMALAKDIIVKAMFKKMLNLQDKYNKALDIYTKFREVNH
jgi:hypothetical protein